jgi:hypothetical protein
MCGTVNAKNSYGGDTGAEPFYAYFSRGNGAAVQDGVIESSDYNIVANWCRSVYGY